MAAVVGYCSASISWVQLKDSSSKRTVKNRFRVSCVSYSAVSDPYKTLRIHPGASVSEVKKAFRQLALQYHPDVCRGSNCGVQFHQINEAYNIVMSNLRGELSNPEMQMYKQYDMAGDDEQMGGVSDQGWDLWEEWMGWDGKERESTTTHPISTLTFDLKILLICCLGNSLLCT